MFVGKLNYEVLPALDFEDSHYGTVEEVIISVKANMISSPASFYYLVLFDLKLKIDSRRDLDCESPLESVCFLHRRNIWSFNNLLIGSELCSFELF